ncbi:hypothetical protein ACE6H2_001684 [Prunus campanulata]
MVQHRFLFLTYPAQGHINLALQLAKRLIRTTGVNVTYVISLYAYRRIVNGSTPNGLTYAPYFDGYDDDFKFSDDVDHYTSELRCAGSQVITDLVASSAKEGHPYTCLVYTILLPWAADLACELHLPSVLAWIQAATLFDVYYYYLSGYKDLIRESFCTDTNDPSCLKQLLGLPLDLASRDLPSFMVAPEALKAIDKYNLIGIGPLIPSAFLDGKDPSDTLFGGDLFQKSMDSSCIEWLNSKSEGFVIYVSFGSVSALSNDQMEEIAKGLLDYGHLFLWVIREKEERNEQDNEAEKEEEKLSCREELEELGKIVLWCCQLEVLSNPSLGCFVTHCGWNSSMESLVSGVPVVAFPLWMDQRTNAKLIEDTWKTGVRVAPNEEGIVVGDELKRCLELVMRSEEIGEELRRNAKKWKGLAREAVSEGGSSDKNLMAFLDQIGN